ncbi:MAG TPA: DUF6191 domain-containing protein [Pseudonocardiaceae bacterium]
MTFGELFTPGLRHQREHRQWVEVHRREDPEAGAGPLDLDSGVVRLPVRRDPEDDTMRP